MITKIFIGESKLDLFEDENINLNSSIVDASDITKNTTEFTQSFTVPASDNNNNIFKHYYEANIDGGFDARVKQDGKIELDGLPFKVGKFRLNGVKMRNGIPDSYNINFWGNLVDLKDKLKNDELSILDLSAYNHTYSSANVKTGLTSSLSGGDIIYNLLVQKQYFYDSTASENTQTETLANIAWGGGANTGVVWNDLRPSIKLISIIEAIETDYAITFSRDFFGRSEFEGLFMFLNNDDNNTLTNTFQIDFDDAGNINSSGSVISLTNDTYVNNIASFLRVHIVPSAGFESVSYCVERYLDGEPWGKSTERSGTSFVDFRTDVDDKEHTLYINSEVSFTFTPTIEVVSGFAGGGSWSATMSEQNFDIDVKPSELMPKLKILDFLKGLFNMFKLVIIPQNDGTIYVNTLKSYYDSGDLIDATPYVDSYNYDVNRGEILNQILFKFEESDTILNTQYFKNNSEYYGNSETYLYDCPDCADRELLDGDSLDVELPFGQMIYERLIDDADSATTYVQYGAIIDEDSNKTNVDAHIFYNISTNLDGKRLGFIDENGAKSELNANINNVSHVDLFENQGFSTVFDEELSEWDGSVIENTLYSNYYKEYIDSIFNIKRRNFKFSAKNFPLRFITQLSLNDTLKIKDNYYRIDNYNINLINGDVEFNLINFFSDNLSVFAPNKSFINTDYNAKTESLYVTNLGTYSAVNQDEGFGTSWVSVSHTGNNLYFQFDENTTGFNRTMTVLITNLDTSQSFEVAITQYPTNIKFSNNTITWDTNNITFDNN